MRQLILPYVIESKMLSIIRYTIILCTTEKVKHCQLNMTQCFLITCKYYFILTERAFLGYSSMYSKSEFLASGNCETHIEMLVYEENVLESIKYNIIPILQRIKLRLQEIKHLPRATEKINSRGRIWSQGTPEPTTTLRFRNLYFVHLTTLSPEDIHQTQVCLPPELGPLPTTQPVSCQIILNKGARDSLLLLGVQGP